MSKILVLHGPNLNLLGAREPEHYGTTNLQEIDSALRERAQQDGISIECRQTNSESELIGWIQQAVNEGVDFIIINPAAYTHTSVAIRDAFAATGIPFVEVHLSNVHRREDFRQFSYVSDLAIGTVTGLGADGYGFAYEYGLRHVLNAD